MCSISLLLKVLQHVKLSFASQVHSSKVSCMACLHSASMIEVQVVALQHTKSSGHEVIVCRALTAHFYMVCSTFAVQGGSNPFLALSPLNTARLANEKSQTAKARQQPRRARWVEWAKRSSTSA